MISSYDMRDKVEAMSPEQRESLPKVKNNNGRDYASCPRCGHYNAMMPERAYEAQFEFIYCRDCGTLGVRA